MINKNKPIIRFGLLIIVSIVYFLSRFQNLLSIPVFCDEAIYIRWSQIIKSVETLRFIPLTDGKQPLFMWALAGLLKFVSDPLMAGRLISIVAGFGIMLGIFFTTCLVLSFNKKTNDIKSFIKDSIQENFYSGLLSTLFYVFIPFSFFFDRLAIADNLLSFFGIWSLLFSLLLAKFKRLDLAMILGATLGFAWLTKSPAIYFIVLSVLTFIILNLKNLKLLFLPIISAVISYAIYNILRLGPQFSMIASRNKDYVWPISEVLKHPFNPLIPHFGDVISLYFQYLSLPVLLFAIFGYILFAIKKQKKAFNLTFIVLITWWILPLTANAAIAKVFTARYVLFTMPSLIILISIGFLFFLRMIKSNLIKTILIISIFILNIVFIYKLSTNPFDQKLTSTEQGYLYDWTSGWGIKESADFLIKRSLVSNVIVGTEGYFGTLPDGLQIYGDKIPNLTIIGLGLGFNKIPDQLVNAKKYGDEVYLIINKSRLNLLPEELNKVKIIKEYPKPGDDKLLLIQI